MLYVKGMGSRCYNERGISFPPLDYGKRVHKFCHNGMTYTFTDKNGRFDDEWLFRSLGAKNCRWGHPWSNQPDALMFDSIDAFSDDVGEILYSLGLIVRPMSDWE